MTTSQGDRDRCAEHADPLDVGVASAAAALLAVGAAALWAAGTVLGRLAGAELTATDVTALRFGFGLLAMVVIVTVRGAWVPVPLAAVPLVLALALVTGLLALSPRATLGGGEETGDLGQHGRQRAGTSPATAWKHVEEEPPPVADDQQQTHDDFAQHVNMTKSELRKWLETDESQSVGAKSGNAQEKSGPGDESTGHQMGRAILRVLDTKKADLSEHDYDDMKRVNGYVKRHLAQQPSKEDVEHSRWRYSLMNWGHDPLK